MMPSAPNKAVANRTAHAKTGHAHAHQGVRAVVISLPPAMCRRGLARPARLFRLSPRRGHASARWAPGGWLRLRESPSLCAMRLSAIWNYPTSIRFGAGRIADLAGATTEAGITRPLFVTDRNLAGLPMTARALEALAPAGAK